MGTLRGKSTSVRIYLIDLVVIVMLCVISNVAFADEFSGQAPVQKMVFNDNQGLQVVPYTIAQLIIESCYGGLGGDDEFSQNEYQCPTWEAFSEFTAAAAASKDFQTAIRKTAQQEHSE